MKNFIEIIKNTDNKISFLVGAGISADSGIPTFRGEEGYWVHGSKNYQPQELATWAMFKSNPEIVWPWYLYRKAVCDKAQPNTSHHCLKNLEDILGQRFALITQNVDGLHHRAGNSLDRLYAIHGNINFVRCSAGCCTDLFPFPEGIDFENRTRDTLLTNELNLLKCPKCNALLRPHVLWFDEYYNEEFYRIDSVLHLAQNTDILFILGTSGATNLPQMTAREAMKTGATLVEVNTDRSLFSDAVEAYEKGHFIQTSSGVFLQELIAHLNSI